MMHEVVTEVMVGMRCSLKASQELAVTKVLGAIFHMPGKGEQVKAFGTDLHIHVRL